MHMVYIKGVDKNQISFMTNSLDEFIDDNNPLCVLLKLLLMY